MTSSSDFSANIPHTSTGNYRVLASYPVYQEAQRLVDQLSDAQFPVAHVRIVGTGIRSVEQVTGRMTKGRAALYGAGSGAWLGLLFGVLFGLFVLGAAWISIIVTALLIGALWGAAFGFVAHWATRGRRDFSSLKAFEAEQYDVLVEADHFDDAVRSLNR